MKEEPLSMQVPRVGTAVQPVHWEVQPALFAVVAAAA